LQPADHITQQDMSQHSSHATYQSLSSSQLPLTIEGVTFGYEDLHQAVNRNQLHNNTTKEQHNRAGCFQADYRRSLLSSVRMGMQGLLFKAGKQQLTVGDQKMPVLINLGVCMQANRNKLLQGNNNTEPRPPYAPDQQWQVHPGSARRMAPGHHHNNK